MKKQSQNAEVEGVHEKMLQQPDEELEFGEEFHLCHHHYACYKLERNVPYILST